jgi:hypothetical protein
MAASIDDLALSSKHHSVVASFLASFRPLTLYNFTLSMCHS